MPSSGNNTFSGWVMTTSGVVPAFFDAGLFAIYICSMPYLDLLFAYDLACGLVEADADQARVPQLVVLRPFDERHLHDDLGPHPMRAQARQADGLRERRLCHFECVETPPQIEQELGVETGADLAREHEVVAIVVTDQQGAQADAGALRIGESADHQLLRALDLELEPLLRAAVFV